MEHLAISFSTTSQCCKLFFSAFLIVQDSQPYSNTRENNAFTIQNSIYHSNSPFRVAVASLNVLVRRRSSRCRSCSAEWSASKTSATAVRRWRSSLCSTRCTPSSTPSRNSTKSTRYVCVVIAQSLQGMCHGTAQSLQGMTHGTAQSL